MNAYLVLFLICFVPLATHRYAQTQKPATPLYPSSEPQEPTLPPPAPPTRSLLYRFVSYLFRKTFTSSSSTRNRKPPPAPPPSSEYTYFAAPPVVQVPQKPSPVSRWFSTSARTRARKAPPPTSQKSNYQRAPLSSYAAARNAEGVITLTAFLGTEGSNVDVDLVVLMAHIQGACKHIGSILSSPKDLQSPPSMYDSSFGNRERDNPRSLRTLSAE